jgi:hypothetical protein
MEPILADIIGREDGDMTNHTANCSFCGRYNTSVQVICELKCLTCSICIKSKCIKDLLCAGLGSDGSYYCPLCDHSMAPNMAITVREFAAHAHGQAAADEGDHMVAADLCEKLNPFSLYFSKGLELDRFDMPTGPPSLLTPDSKATLQRCNTLLSSIEDTNANKLSSVGILEFIVDIYCLVR